MQTIQPVSNNQFVRPIRPVDQNILDIKSQGTNVSIGFVNVISGNIVPTIAGTYSVVGPNGTPIVLPPTSLILGISVSGNNLVGGTSIEIDTAATEGGVPVSIILPAQTTAAVNGCIIAAPAIAAPGNVTSFIVATTVGIFTSGSANIRIYYLNQ